MRTRRITLPASLLFLVPFVSHASSVMLLRYTAPSGNEFAPELFSNLVNASGILLGSSLASIEPGIAVPGSIHLSATASSNSPEQSVINAQFMQFTVTANPGCWFVPGSISFDVTRGGASSTRGWALTSSLNNHATLVASLHVSSVQPTYENLVVNLDSFSGAVNSAVFRLYVYTPEADTGLFIDNITFSGSAVPEWSTLSFLPFVIATLFIRRRSA